MQRNPELGQFFTPTWAAELIVQKFLPDLSANDCVVDPGAGDGRFLLAVPAGIDAYGVEIDPVVAKLAEQNTGRQIITGDFRTVALPRKPTVILGNPPYKTDIIDGFLDRSYEELDYGGRVLFLLPAYVFQTASRVMGYASRFSIEQVMVPRNLFEQMEKPLMLATFRKDRRPFLTGFFLYEELDAVTKLSKKYRFMFIGNQSRASLWGEVVEQAMANLGGEASLQELYQEIEGKQPTSNSFWKEQVRKIVQKACVRVRKGVYKLMPHQDDLFSQTLCAA